MEHNNVVVTATMSDSTSPPTAMYRQNVLANGALNTHTNADLYSVKCQPPPPYELPPPPPYTTATSFHHSSFQVNEKAHLDVVKNNNIKKRSATVKLAIPPTTVPPTYSVGNSYQHHSAGLSLSLPSNGVNLETVVPSQSYHNSNMASTVPIHYNGTSEATSINYLSNIPYNSSDTNETMKHGQSGLPQTDELINRKLLNNFLSDIVDESGIGYLGSSKPITGIIQTNKVSVLNDGQSDLTSMNNVKILPKRKKTISVGTKLTKSKPFQAKKISINKSPNKVSLSNSGQLCPHIPSPSKISVRKQNSVSNTMSCSSSLHKTSTSNIVTAHKGPADNFPEQFAVSRPHLSEISQPEYSENILHLNSTRENGQMHFKQDQERIINSLQLCNAQPNYMLPDIMSSSNGNISQASFDAIDYEEPLLIVPATIAQSLVKDFMPTRHGLDIKLPVTTRDESSSFQASQDNQAIGNHLANSQSFTPSVVKNKKRQVTVDSSNPNQTNNIKLKKQKLSKLNSGNHVTVGHASPDKEIPNLFNSKFIPTTMVLAANQPTFPTAAPALPLLTTTSLQSTMNSVTHSMQATDSDKMYKITIRTGTLFIKNPPVVTVPPFG